MEIDILVTLYFGVAVILFHIEWNKPGDQVLPWTGLVCLLWPLLVLALLSNLTNPPCKSRGNGGKDRK